jgi:putative ABC transport system substrate-binding protein
MYVSGWPVEGGLVASYARPGGNITGLAIYGSDEMYTKFMSLIVELLPGARELGMIWDYVPPAFLEKEVELGIGSLKRAARQLKLNTRDWPIHTEKDLERALFEISTARPDALFATSGPVHGQPHNVTRINEFALRHRLPLVCDIAGSVFRGGGLLAYAASWDELAERCASFVDRILRGANPAELPIELPTRFELVINLKTAKSIGLAVPQSLLGRADRVIE